MDKHFDNFFLECPRLKAGNFLQDKPDKFLFSKEKTIFEKLGKLTRFLRLLSQLQYKNPEVHICCYFSLFKGLIIKAAILTLFH